MEPYETSWKDYYSILRVRPNDNLSVIAAAYSRLSRELHEIDPDATAQMRDINEAFGILADRKRRAAYDAFDPLAGSHAKNTRSEKSNPSVNPSIDSSKNYYEILQVSPNATATVITAAYRRLAREYHPDIVGSSSAQRMKEINESYAVLSNPASKAAYDQTFRSNENQQDGPAPSADDLMATLVAFAAKRAGDGKNRTQVADELAQKGVPYQIAAEVVNQVFDYRSTLKRREGGKQIGCGFLMLIVGGIITGLTFLIAAPGGTFIVTTGLFIVGAITLIVGLVRWLSS